MPQLRLALSGRITDHHRFLLRELMDDLERVENKIQRLEAASAQWVDMRLVERLCGIPGLDVITAWTLIAALGTDMSVFASPKHAASWAGLCPGNHESGGKRLSNRTRKATNWLRRALVQSAWGASRKRTATCRLSSTAMLLNKVYARPSSRSHIASSSSPFACCAMTASLRNWEAISSTSSTPCAPAIDSFAASTARPRRRARSST
jgi:transposase